MHYDLLLILLREAGSKMFTDGQLEHIFAMVYAIHHHPLHVVSKPVQPLQDDCVAIMRFYQPAGVENI